MVSRVSTKKELKFQLQVRVYGQRLNPHLSHSYCVDDEPTGISPTIGTLTLDVRSTTVKQLRNIIQYDQSGYVNKRKLMFQEAVFIMQRLPNYYNRDSNELMQFLLGFMRKDTKQVKLIHKDQENEVIAALISATDFFLHDLIIVPLSQIPRDIETTPVDKNAIDGISLPNIIGYTSPIISNRSNDHSNSMPISPLVSSRSRQRSALEEARENDLLIVSGITKNVT